MEGALRDIGLLQGHCDHDYYAFNCSRDDEQEQENGAATERYVTLERNYAQCDFWTKKQQEMSSCLFTCYFWDILHFLRPLELYLDTETKLNCDVPKYFRRLLDEQKGKKSIRNLLELWDIYMGGRIGVQQLQLDGLLQGNCLIDFVLLGVYFSAILGCKALDLCAKSYIQTVSCT